MGRKQSQSAAAVWRDRLARFHKSGLTVAEFCRREGVSNPSFYQWRKRLRQSAPRSNRSRRPEHAEAEPLPTFVPLTIPPPALAEIEFPDGVRIRVPVGNREALRAVLHVGREMRQEASEC
jgi:transposase-like protein